MTRIALVVSDVDGTLLTKDKTLTEASIAAVRRLRAAGIGFTITSSRPTIGMRFLIEPLGITLPVGAFNGSSIVDAGMNPIEQHLIPVSTVERSLELLQEFGVDIWLFTNEHWFTKNPDGEYVPNEKRAIKADPTIIDDFAPYLSRACKLVGASSDAALLARCEAAVQKALARKPPRCARRATISTSPHRARTRAPSCRPWRGGSAFPRTRWRPWATCTTTWRCSM